MASRSASGATSSGTYAQSSPRAANAAFCIRGESDPETGCPTRPTRRVAPVRPISAAGPVRGAAGEAAAEAPLVRAAAARAATFGG